MEMKIERNCIEIIPENEEDEAYLEEVLGLKKDGDVAVAIRRDVYGIDKMAFVEIRKKVVK